MGFGVACFGYEEKLCGSAFIGLHVACIVGRDMLGGHIYDLHGVMSISIS